MRRLRTQFVLLFVGFATFLLLVVGVGGITMVQQQFKTYAKNNRELQSLQVLHEVELNLAQDGINPDYLHTLGETLLADGIVLNLQYERGEALYRTACEVGSPCMQHMEEQTQWLASQYPTWNIGYYETSFVLVHEGTLLEMTLGYSSAYRLNKFDVTYLNRMQVLFLFLAMLCIGLVFIVAHVVTKQVGKPLERLQANIKLLTQRDYHEPIAIQSKSQELHDLEVGLSQLQLRLLQQQNFQERALRDLSHELRTPLTITQAQLEAMQDGVLPITRERLQTCVDEMVHLQAMVAQLHDVLEEKQHALQCSPCALDELVDGVCKGFAPQLQQEQLQLVQTCEPVMAFVDEGKIKQVIINVLSNAIKYAKPQTSIHVVLQQRNHSFRLQIQDEGIGISQADLPFVCEYLYRSDASRSRKQGGSGIGLAVVSSIVHAHQGTIQIESKEDVGTCVTLEFPLQTIEKYS
ncbi:MAG: sensor histidine kinase [Erysipelotrichaceae bacterium]